MPTWYLKLKHYSGKVTVKKIKTKAKTPKAVRRAYYHSAHHFNTEATVLKISKKKTALKRKKRR